jgi:hypothetical protein
VKRFDSDDSFVYKSIIQPNPLEMSASFTNFEETFDNNQELSPLKKHRNDYSSILEAYSYI